MKIIRTVLLLGHLIVLGLLFGTIINAYIPPSIFAGFDLLSLAFPVLLILHFILTILWIMMWKRRAFIFIIATAFLYNPICRWFNWNTIKGESNFKVVTLNVKGAKYGKSKIENFLKDQNADLVFLQEDAAQVVLGDQPIRHSLVAIYSPHEITNKTPIDLEEGVARSFYADIDFNGKKIRVINVYLESFQIQKNMVKPSEDTEVNKRKARKLLGHLLPTFKEHEKQIRIIKKIANDSPYPVIIAGDFNSVPNSWEYYHISKGLTDSFMSVGRGLGTTFHDFKFPIRIDYIFTSSDFKPIKIKVDRNQKISDHYPTIAEYNFQ